MGLGKIGNGLSSSQQLLGFQSRGQPYAELRAFMERAVHANTVAECINPQVAVLAMLGVIQHGESMVWAMRKVQVSDLVGIIQEICFVVRGFGAEEMHPVQQIHQRLAQVGAYQRLPEYECEKVPSRQVPLEGFVLGKPLGGGDVEFERGFR
jgi:hypothetical protein